MRLLKSRVVFLCMFTPILTRNVSIRGKRSSLFPITKHIKLGTSIFFEVIKTGMQRASITKAAILVLRFQLGFFAHQPPAGEKTYLG